MGGINCYDKAKPGSKSYLIALSAMQLKDYHYYATTLGMQAECLPIKSFRSLRLTPCVQPPCRPQENDRVLRATIHNQALHNVHSLLCNPEQDSQRSCWYNLDPSNSEED